MRRVLFLLLALACALPLVGAGLAALAVSAQPTLPAPARMGGNDFGQVLSLFKRNDPRRARPGTLQAATLGERDLELLLAQGARRLGTDLRAKVALGQGLASLQASVALPTNPFGPWLNLQASLRQTSGLPEVASLRVGAVPVPGWLANWALGRVLASQLPGAQTALALRMVKQVNFVPQWAAVTYAWPAQGPSMRQALADTLLPPAEQARLRVYVEALARLTQPLPEQGLTLPLTQLMPPLFSLAASRTHDDADARLENRAALLALALSADRMALPRLVSTSIGWQRPRTLKLVLRGRDDFPLHFLVSAVIAAEGGGPLADAVGVFKEVSDSRGGSGFSFNDIAADRAGTRFGLQAVRAPRALQQRLASGLRDDDLLPPVDDLPEFLTEPEFRRRYGGVDAPAYRAVMADIESRLDRLALLGPALPGAPATQLR